MIEKIISGGQTGVDLAALDAAIEFNIPCGGWCPKGRTNLKGIIPKKYKFLVEIFGEFKTDKENRDARTKANINDSDGTLIFVPSNPLPANIQDGTLVTIKEAKDRKKPFLIMDLSKPYFENIPIIMIWLKANEIKTLNIAGPTELTCPDIYQSTTKFLEELFTNLGYTKQQQAKL